MEFCLDVIYRCPPYLIITSPHVNETHVNGISILNRTIAIHIYIEEIWDPSLTPSQYTFIYRHHHWNSREVFFSED